MWPKQVRKAISRCGTNFANVHEPLTIRVCAFLYPPMLEMPTDSLPLQLQGQNYVENGPVWVNIINTFTTVIYAVSTMFQESTLLNVAVATSYDPKLLVKSATDRAQCHGNFLRKLVRSKSLSLASISSLA
jgi:hypothetical protein